ncbi:MAG: FKBP-type peptidyl-prolyl cis-trans isomerase [Candidatus Dormibacteraeota bacterium]|nr:FKBP-type peptidyl-prolyl cis-trans isomerase [Candidatus Dormibacteraeota bacterium]
MTLTAEKDGLQVGDVNLGCGAQVRKGQQVTIQYTGWLKNGTEFDSSRSQGRQPVAFVLGQGQLIPGVEEGILGMNVGGKRRLVLPPALAYGAAGAPPVIPPNATIVFDIEVISVT